MAEDKGEHVRLDWKGEEPTSNMHDARAATAPLALKLNLTLLFSCRFFAGKHTIRAATINTKIFLRW